MQVSSLGHFATANAMPESAVEVLVIGGGILGLSTALTIRKLRPQARICLVEKEASPAMHQSGRNSGVLHSGIYYPPGSLKASLCLAGYQRMRSFCEEQRLPIRVSGKLIVATEPHEEARLRVLFDRGKSHGLTVTWLNAEQAKEFEPHVRCHSAVHVAETAVVDFPRVCEALLQILREQQVYVLLGTTFRGAKIEPDGFTAHTNRRSIAARAIVNCGGLQCDRVARRAGAQVPGRIIPFRGDYYDLRPGRENLVKSMIYPVPDERFPFLGVHFTRAAHGTVHVGPNAVLSLAREGYSLYSFSLPDMLSTGSFPGFWKFSSRHLATGLREFQGAISQASFARRARRLIPSLNTNDLVPSRAGIRAQAVNPEGNLVEDFSIVRSGTAWHVFNAPSPAATSSLAIAETIAREVVQAIA